MLRSASLVLALLTVLAANAPARAALIVDIEPVSICLDDGSSCGAIGFNTATLNSFWNPLGLTLNILATRNFNSTTFQTMDTLAEASTFVVTNPSPDPAGPTNFSSSPITMWFSTSAFSPPGTIDVSVVGANRSWIASNLPSFHDYQLSRALGINLGLSFVSNDPTNLMTSLFSDPDLSHYHLTQGQIDILLESNFIREGELVAAPEPGTIALFGAALAALGFRRRRS